MGDHATPLRLASPNAGIAMALPQRRAARQSMRTSVLVPCAPSHVRLLPALLRSLTAQTQRPDEIIVATGGRPNLSELARIAPVRIVLTSPRANASTNRNLAADASTGAILIYQDADDVPHPQRVALIKAAFEWYDIDHLMHYFTYDPKPLSRRHSDSAIILQRQDQYSFDLSVTNGNPATSRRLHRTIWWNNDVTIGEDVDFNTRATSAFPGRSAILPLPLLHYRRQLSATIAR